MVIVAQRPTSIWWSFYTYAGWRVTPSLKNISQTPRPITRGFTSSDHVSKWNSQSEIFFGIQKIKHILLWFPRQIFGQPQFALGFKKCFRRGIVFSPQIYGFLSTQIQFHHLYYAWSYNGWTIFTLEILEYGYFLCRLHQIFGMRYNIPTDFSTREWYKCIHRLVGYLNFNQYSIVKSQFLILLRSFSGELRVWRLHFSQR